MLNLAQEALYALVKSGTKVDMTDPVIRDVIYSIMVTKGYNLKQIQKLRFDIGRAKASARQIANFKKIPSVDYYSVDKVTTQLSVELFDIFTWNRVQTPTQAVWKEYFHSVYDLLVPESSDHIGNLVMAVEIIKYHDVIPKPVEPIDVRDTNLHTIKRLINELKQEQVNIARLVGDLPFHIVSCNRQISDIQVDIVKKQRMVELLQDDMTKLVFILNVDSEPSA